MTDDEIIDVVSAHKAGMRIEFRPVASSRYHEWMPSQIPAWNFPRRYYRVHPDDAERWERIKNLSSMHGDRRFDPPEPEVMTPPGPLSMTAPEPDLPLLPKGAVLLPVGFRLPEDMEQLEIWCSIPGCRQWDWGSCWGWFGGDPGIRYAVRPDTEIARINGVGFGPCPSPHGWHNPDGFTPEQVGVPEYRLLCRDEVEAGERDVLGKNIERFELGRWRCRYFYLGSHPEGMYRTSVPYGQLPSVKRHTFPECAPEREYGYANNSLIGIIPAELGNLTRLLLYAYTLDGHAITDPDQDHEIIPEGTEVYEGEVTHWYLEETGWHSLIADEDFRGVAEVAEDIRAIARKKYSVLHAESGIETGDTVRVTRAAEDYERGWRNIWREEMNAFVDKTVKVVDDEGILGFKLRSPLRLPLRFCFPAFVLEKVERRKVPLEWKDWCGGPWCVKDVSGTPKLVVEVRLDWIVAGEGSVYRYPVMMHNVERARGWPGDADLAWEPCWKWESDIRDTL